MWKRDRKGGAYYSSRWQAATAAGADAVLINSFNGWMDGTQIEPAAAAAAAPTGGATADEPLPYQTYEGGPDRYLDETVKLAQAFVEQHGKAKDEL